jgi:hypothetical protein
MSGVGGDGAEGRGETVRLFGVGRAVNQRRGGFGAWGEFAEGRPGDLGTVAGMWDRADVVGALAVDAKRKTFPPTWAFLRIYP